MNKKKRFAWWIIPLVVLAAGAGILVYFKAHPVQVKAPAVDMTKVHTTKVVVGSISSGISTTGAVRTNQNVSLAWKTSGQVAQVMVKVGDQVQQDQILAQLDPASNTTFATEQASLLSAQENLASMQDTTAATAAAQIALIQAQTALANAQKVVDALQVMPTQAQIDAAYAVTLQDQKMVDRLQIAFNLLASNPETDLNRANALTALNNAIQKENLDVGAYNQLKNHQPDAAALAAAQSNLSLAQQKLAVAQANYTLASAGPDTAKIAAAQASIQQIQATLDQQYIRAPSAGTVTGVTVQVDDLVNPGTAAFRIDDFSSLYIDVPVSEVDINHVQIGQVVELTYAAVSEKGYTAKVTGIGTTGSVSGGVASYTVTAQLADADILVRPGMTATANIVTQQLNNALLVPNLSIASLNGRKVVYVVTSGKVNPISVTVSLISDTQTALAGSSLKAGDAIVTNPSSLTAAPTSTGIQAMLENLFLKLGVIVYS
jgi:HlyD family secretion protein